MVHVHLTQYRAQWQAGRLLCCERRGISWKDDRLLASQGGVPAWIQFTLGEGTTYQQNKLSLLQIHLPSSPCKTAFPSHIVVLLIPLLTARTPTHSSFFVSFLCLYINWHLHVTCLTCSAISLKVVRYVATRIVCAAWRKIVFSAISDIGGYP